MKEKKGIYSPIVWKSLIGIGIAIIIMVVFNISIIGILNTIAWIVGLAFLGGVLFVLFVIVTGWDKIKEESNRRKKIWEEKQKKESEYNWRKV